MEEKTTKTETRGRKPLPKGQVKHTKSVRATETIWSSLEVLAENANETTSAYTTKILEDHVNDNAELISNINNEKNNQNG